MKTDAIVVGAGPNGLAAAVTLARAGCSVQLLEANPTVGGGARSDDQLTLPGFVHDLGSAVHPLGVGSPFFRQLPLADFGLEWVHPELPLAHPLDGDDAQGQPAAAFQARSVDATAAALAAADGLPAAAAAAYRRVYAPLTARWDKLAAEFLQPLLHLPRYPFTLAHFGLQALWPARAYGFARFAGRSARALFAGMAAHSFLPLEAPGSAAFGLVLGAAGHAVGWPSPRGGAQKLADALAGLLRSLGGRIETGVRVTRLGDLPPARTVLLDVGPRQFLALAGRQLPTGYRHRLERYRYGPGAFKVDFALDGPVPWRSPACRRAGTVHVGGTLEEIAAGERAVAAGTHPDRPFVLVAQPSVADPTRAPAGRHVLWTYCHVPNGSRWDLTDRIEAQIERFAPGFRDRILARRSAHTADLARQNHNLVGGDVNGGAADLWQLVARPVLSPRPYRTPLPGVYLCSASTPPGGGVHGMAGWQAARLALAERFGAPSPQPTRAH